MKKRLITSALPYVNNIPHLGNLIQVLSADVFARFCRSRGYETLYVCGTDEYGTATETRAQEEGKTPRELCDYYHAIHAEIYAWFGIAFDHFGRTSDPEQTEITQALFLDLDKNGFIIEKTTEQLYCPSCKRFLADRYVRGTCPHCGAEDARGDQCEKCGKLLEPTDLQSPRCSSCSARPELRSTKHLYIDLPSIQKNYTPWMQEASKNGRWAKNAMQTTQAWIRDGLQVRAITRDLKWGIPVPKVGFEDKVFYVWFDAPIGYMSITKALANKLKREGKPSFDWKSWWLPAEPVTPPQTVELFQFIGKDNIPFHTVIFPSTLIGSGRNWTKLHHMSSSEYLNYESGKFSKSKGIGIFGSDAKESGIVADAWRFYIFFNRPEKADTQFTWQDFQEKYNGELIGNLGNLVNRTFTFVTRYYGGAIPQGEPDAALWDAVRQKEARITELLEWAEEKEAFHEIFALSDIANKAFQDGEPWKTRNTESEKAAALIRDLCYVIKDLMILCEPYLPHYCAKVLAAFGINAGDLHWDELAKTDGLTTVGENEIYFKPLDDKTVAAFREKYAGTQAERTAAEAPKDAKSSAESKKAPEAAPILGAAEQIEHFAKNIRLKTAKIIDVQKHPDADKLYVEKLDDGSGNERTILSGLVPYLMPEELLGKTVIIADNLAPRKMRGIESFGMLLAADYTDETGAEKVEVLTCPWASAGTPVTLAGQDATAPKPDIIDADTFFAVTIEVKDHTVCIGGKPLVANGKEVRTEKTVSGEVH
ncbi:MAG: methionine--tRNA ligase [Treponemataceae bacterium]|nr:MAG: methionine--tRNA ligase [Treponemataceae bacterium]